MYHQPGVERIENQHHRRRRCRPDVLTNRKLLREVICPFGKLLFHSKDVVVGRIEEGINLVPIIANRVGH